MGKSLTGKTILVLGAGGLLGISLVRELLDNGASVVAIDKDLMAMRKRLSTVISDLSISKIEIQELDVTDEESIKQLLGEYTKLNGAVNCSYPRNEHYGNHFFDVSLASFNENLSLHLGSAFLFMQQCAAYFERNKSDFTLVNIASIYGLVAPKFEIYADTQMTTPVEYAAIKSAIIHLTKYVSSYVKDSRFRVNCVSPGGIKDSQPDSFLQRYRANTNGKGMLDVADVIGTILFLLSDESRFISGQNIVIDDGFTL